MKKLLFAAALLFSVNALFAQNPPGVKWSKHFGGTLTEDGLDMCYADNGAYVVAGLARSTDNDVSGNNGYADVWITRHDSLGNLEWERNYGGSFVDYSAAITPSFSDGGYFVVGHTESTDGDATGNHGYEDAWVGKLNYAGYLEWSKCLGGTSADRAYDVLPTWDDGCIIVGFAGSNNGDVIGNHGGKDVWVIKLDYSGAIEWQKCYGGSNDDIGWCIAYTQNGGYFIGGESQSDDGDLTENKGIQDLWLFEIDYDGNLLWQKTYGGSGYDRALSIAVTSSNACVLVGNTSSYDGDVANFHGSLVSSITDCWVVKISSSGNLQWETAIGGTFYDQGHDIEITPTGYIISGVTNSSDGDINGTHGDYDALLFKLDNAGNKVWLHSYGGSGYDYGATILPSGTSTDLRVVGFSYSSDGDVPGNYGQADTWLFEVSPNISACPIQASADTTVCILDPTVNLVVSGSTAYTWSPATSLNTTTGDSIIATPSQTTTYTVTGTDVTGCTAQDTVVVSVSLCPAASNVSTTNVASATANVNWNGNACALKYRVRVKNMVTGVTNIYFVLAPNTTKALTGLSSNTLYKVQVRSQCSTNGSVLSPWSLPVYFTTSGTSTCIAPTNLTATSASNTSENISWTSVAGAAGYQLRYKINGATIWTPVVINNGATSNHTLNALTPNTTYNFQMRTKCSASPLTWSNYTSIQTFTTPLRLGDDENSSRVQLYPNPSNGTVTFNSNGLVGTLSIYDAVGKNILHQTVSTIQTILNGLPAGLLTYKFINANGVMQTEKFVVVKN